MKLLKITAIGVVAALLCLFIYANTRTLSPTEQLRSVNIASFQLQGGTLTAKDRSSLENLITATRGVTACSISKEGNIAAVIFYPQSISADELKTRIGGFGKVSASLMAFPETPGCPVHAVGDSVADFVSLLDLRN